MFNVRILVLIMISFLGGLGKKVNLGRVIKVFYLVVGVELVRVELCGEDSLCG